MVVFVLTGLALQAQSNLQGKAAACALAPWAEERPHRQKLKRFTDLARTVGDYVAGCQAMLCQRRGGLKLSRLVDADSAGAVPYYQFGSEGEVGKFGGGGILAPAVDFPDEYVHGSGAQGSGRTAH